MTNPETNSSQTSSPNASNDTDTSPTNEEDRVSKIRNYLGLFADFGTVMQTLPTIIISVLILILFFSFRDNITVELSCVKSSNPLEILAALGGTVGLTVLGVAFAPAAILSIAIWLIIKFSYFCG